MIRPLLQEVLGHAVHARMSMDSLKVAIIEEMESGHRPTYRGHAWGRDQFADLEAAAAALEAAFQYLKSVQFPETRASRLAQQLEGGEDQRSDSGSSSPQLPPGG